ncbi:MAG TPA: radical SAM protein [Desulfobacterales bacterium]
MDTGIPPYPLQSIYFYPTESCNLRCVHCWVRPHHVPDPKAYQFRNRENITVEQMEAVIREALPLGLQHVKFTGGEPLLSPLFFDYLKCFSRYGLRFGLETNATLVDTDAARRLKKYAVHLISTSLDGSTPEKHERIRRVPGSFDRTLQGIRALIGQGIHPQVIFCLQQSNFHDLEDTIRLAEELRIRSFEINPLITIGGDNGQNGCRGLEIEQLLQLECRIEEDYPRRFRKISVNLYLPPALKGMRLLSESRLCTCRIFNICGILSNGDVSVCGIAMREKNLVMGNVTRQSISAIWREGSLFQKIRRELPRNLHGVCGQCLFLWQCLGFCRADALFDGRDLLAPNEFCQDAHAKGLFPRTRLLETEG